LPSGEALLRSEMPLIDLAKRLGRVMGPQWTTTGHRSTEIWNAFQSGGQTLDENRLIMANFGPPERLDEMTEIAVQTARANLYSLLQSISDPILLRKVDVLTEKEIQEMLQGREERAAALGPVEPEDENPDEPQF
jgi:hypothetical protein